MDPNTALVFESIGLIKKSLQCSICLDLFNDPHSTRCNHQFCSHCIRKVVDERKDRKKEALCPLCKNPITKRSLTSNPRLKEIVEVVGKLNIAFQEDAGLPDSPYPLVNSKLNGKSYLQFAHLNPTPLKLTKFTSSKLGGATTEQLLNSCLNHQSSKYGLRSRRRQPGAHERPTSAQVVSNKQTSTGMEILSLLESQEDIQPEAPTKYILDEEVDKIGNEILQERNTDSPNTRRTPQQENVNTANTGSSGSLTIDAGKSTQSSVISNNSVSMLDALLSPESATQRNNGVDEVNVEEEETHHSFTVNKQNILKSPAGDKANSPISERVTGNCTSSNDIFNEVQKSPIDRDVLRKTTPEVVYTSKSKPSPSNPSCKKSNLVKESCEPYSSERVPASVDSDSQSYTVIPLPRYQRLHSDDEISPEFHNPHSILSGPDKNQCFNEIISTAEKISSQVEPCLSSEIELIEGEQIQSEKVTPSAENVFRAGNCQNPDVLILSASGSSSHRHKRKHSDEDNSSCSKRLKNEGQVTSIDNKACQNNLVKNRRSNLDTDQLNSPAKKVGKESCNHLPAHTKVCDPEVDDHEIENPSHSQVTNTCDDSDDIIPPTPPERTDLGCTSPKKTNTSTLGYTRQFRTSRSKLNEVEEVLGKGNWFKDGACTNDGGVVSDGGPIMDGDQIYSSQEDLLFRENDHDDQDNVALLRRLASTFSCHKESEIESDDETSDCKTGDTTSISSLTDGDGVEISSQRITYLHEVLAQTGGEIEKLTTDLKNLKKSEVTAQLVQLKHDHVDIEKENVMRDDVRMNKVDIGMNKDDRGMNKDDRGMNKDNAGMKRVNVRMNRNDVRMKGGKNDFENDSSSDTEKDFDSDCDSSSKKRIDNIETLDKENNAEILERSNNFYGKLKENDETSDLENDVQENGNDQEFSSDQENEHAVDCREDKDGDKDDSDDGDSDDVEVLEHCSLSPPPSLELSTLKLTKLPAAIKNMQRLLQQDSEDEMENISSPSYHVLEVEEVFENKRANDAPASKARCHVSPRVDTSADVQVMKTGEGRLTGSQKENEAELELRSGSRTFPPRRLQDTNKQDVTKYGGAPNGVLAEINAGFKQRTLTTMLRNGLSNKVRKEPGHVKPSVCFVVTRLPKQFVSLAGYLAKQNDGKVSSDVTEETTHIIMPTDSRMHASRKNYTIKYLLGIALGKWIVSQLWITASVKSGCLIDEKQYEVKGDVAAAQSHVPSLARTTRENKAPFLFDGISVVCFGEFSGAISQEHVCQLVRYCGGQVIDFSQELLKFNSTISDLIIICDTRLSGNKEFQIKGLCKRFSTFPVSSEWVTDSVANYQLQDIEEYHMDI